MSDFTYDFFWNIFLLNEVQCFDSVYMSILITLSVLSEEWSIWYDLICESTFAQFLSFIYAMVESTQLHKLQRAKQKVKVTRTVEIEFQLNKSCDISFKCRNNCESLTENSENKFVWLSTLLSYQIHPFLFSAFSTPGLRTFGISISLRIRNFIYCTI